MASHSDQQKIGISWERATTAPGSTATLQYWRESDFLLSSIRVTSPEFQLVSFEIGPVRYPLPTLETLPYEVAKGEIVRLGLRNISKNAACASASFSVSDLVGRADLQARARMKAEDAKSDLVGRADLQARARMKAEDAKRQQRTKRRLVELVAQILIVHPNMTAGDAYDMAVSTYRAAHDEVLARLQANDPALR